MPSSILLIAFALSLAAPGWAERGGDVHNDDRHDHKIDFPKIDIKLPKIDDKSKYTDPLLSEVMQTATSVQKDLKELDKSSDQLEKAPPADVEKKIAEQERVMASAEQSAGAYLDAEDNYFARYKSYVYPDLRSKVVAQISGAKSTLAFQQAQFDMGAPKTPDKTLNDLKGPDLQAPKDPQARQQSPAGTTSEARQRTAGERDKAGLEASAKGPVWIGNTATAGSFGGGYAGLDSKRLEGRIRAPDGSSPGLASVPAGRPLEEAARRPAAARDAETAKQGLNLIASGKTLEALSWARQMIAADPKNAAGHRLLAMALSGLGRYDEAERAALDAIRLDPNDPEGYIALAWAKLHMKKYEEALRAVNRALELGPGNAKAYALRALIYEQLGQREKMLADLRKAAALDPERYGEHLRRALAGQRLFDPNDPNSDLLLDGLPLGGSGARPLAWGAGLAALCLLGGGFVALRRRRKTSVVGAGRAGAAGSAEAGTAQAVAEAPAAEAPAPTPAQLFAMKYRMSRQTARTARNEIWEAQDTSLGRAVLVRRLRFDADELGEKRRRRALRDIRLLADLRHPGVEMVLEVVEAGREVHLALEATPWGSAEALVKASGPLPLDKARPIMVKVCDALSAAHKRGLLHRCITPAKVLISEQGYVRLVDFGSWGGLEEGFRAPETEGGVEVPATDIYSLGATLYALLTGKPPYEGDVAARRAKRDFKEPSACAPGLPPAVDALVKDALDPAPAGRPQSAQVFLDRLLRA